MDQNSVWLLAISFYYKILWCTFKCFVNLVSDSYFHLFLLQQWEKLKIFALLPYSAVVFASTVTYLSYKFSWSNPFLVSINKLITGRLALGRNAFDTFGVHLFGTRNVQFIGSGGKTESVIGYNYVDSSYVQMLFTYGIVSCSYYW